MSDAAVVLVCDRGFLPYAAYLAAELDRLHPRRNFDLVILGPDLSPLPPDLGEIRVRRFEGENPFEHRALKRRRSHASYLCLMLPELLPEYRRILYLDCDIVPDGTMDGLLSVDLHGQALGAVRDHSQWRRPKRLSKEFKRLDLPAERYLNSGVLLFDVERWSAEGWTQSCVDVARDPALAKGYARNDQSAINLALRGRWTELSPVWNWQWTELSRYFADDAGARLIHFIGPDKPWRSATLPPRFTRDYAPFLARFFPEAATPPAPEPRLDRHLRAYVRHRLRAHATQAYFGRFADPLTTHAPEEADDGRAG